MRTRRAFITGAVSAVLSSSLPRTAPAVCTTPPPATGLFQAGNVYWGFQGFWNGGNGQGQFVKPDATVIGDLKNICGTAPNTIPYRAFGPIAGVNGASTNASAIAPYVAAGIIPSIGFYLPTTGTATAAFNQAQSDIAPYVSAIPAMPILELGNEEDLQVVTIGGSNNHSSPSDWRASAAYPAILGYHAGMIAYMRDHSPTTLVVGGASAGWIYYGLPIALMQDLAAYTTPAGPVRNLQWDLTCIHHYQDTSCPNCFGTGLSTSTAGNQYQNFFPAIKSLAVTEFGSSSNSPPGSDSQASTYITGLMNDMINNRNPTANSVGVTYATLYQLYRGGNFPNLGVYSSAGVINDNGVQMKAFIAAHGNPSNH